MKKNFHYSSDFLFAESGFLTGIGSVLNISGNYYDFATSGSEGEADAKALENDWGVIGQDIKTVIKNSTRVSRKELESCL